MKTLIVISLAFIFPLFSFGQVKLYPKNEIHKDSSLADFVCKLQYAIFKKDKAFLLSVVDKKIKNSFGGDDGIEEFKQMWKVDDANSEIWFYLSKLVSLGGTFSNYNVDQKSQSSFVFPYVYNLELPNDSIDIFSVMAATAATINVRSKPEISSKVLGQLNYDIVEVNYDHSVPMSTEKKLKNAAYPGEKEWYYVTTLDKKLSGFVYWEYLWSPVDYRLFLNKINGQWKITCLIAGD